MPIDPARKMATHSYLMHVPYGTVAWMVLSTCVYKGMDYVHDSSAIYVHDSSAILNCLSVRGFYCSKYHTVLFCRLAQLP